MANVANMRHRPALRAALGGPEAHRDTVPIDRRPRWSSSFAIGGNGDRARVTERYRSWLWHRIGSGEVPLADLAALNGKRLACTWSC